MNTRAIIVAMLFAGCTLLAQEVAYIDLTAATQRTALRQVPPKCPQGVNCVGGGFGGGVGGDCGTVISASRIARVSIGWTDSVSYEDGEDAAWEAKIENIGRETFDIPISPHLSDLQPEEAGLPFHYLQMSFMPMLRIASSTANFGFLTIYGTSSTANSIVSLKPGEWIRVRGTSKVDFQGRKQIEGPLTVRLLIQKVTYTSSPERSGTFAAPSCPDVQYVEGPVVRVLPASSKPINTEN